MTEYYAVYKYIHKEIKILPIDPAYSEIDFMAAVNIGELSGEELFYLANSIQEHYSTTIVETWKLDSNIRSGNRQQDNPFDCRSTHPSGEDMARFVDDLHPEPIGEQEKQDEWPAAY